MFAVWLILGAIINPTAFLPYSSGSGTFITFCFKKASDFVKLVEEGRKTLMARIEELYDKVNHGIMGKILDKVKNPEALVSTISSVVCSGITAKLATKGVLNESQVQQISQKMFEFQKKAIEYSHYNSADLIEKLILDLVSVNLM